VSLEIAVAREPLPAGVARALLLEVKNAGRDAVLLESATLAPGSALFAPGPTFSWRRRAEGVIAYDAARDRYVHAADVLGVSPVPLHVGVLPPGARAETLLPARLGASTRVKLTLAFRVAEKLEGRVYSSPPGVQGASVVYSPGLAPGPAIVRDADLPRQELVVAVDLVVEGALPAGMVARSRALGWLEEGLRVDGHTVNPEVIDLMDVVYPGDSLVVLFRGERGAAVRRALGLDVNAAGQGLVPYESARSLVAVVAKSGAKLSVGHYWEGFVVD
jgi:hypothetical protein